MTEILECFRTGSNSLWSSLLAPRIDRIVLAATKADHLHHKSHDRLEAILAALTKRAIARVELVGAEVDVIALSAVRATREGMVGAPEEPTLEAVIGTPLEGERIGEEIFDGQAEAAIYPGELPIDPASGVSRHSAHRAPRNRRLPLRPFPSSRPGPKRGWDPAAATPYTARPRAAVSPWRPARLMFSTKACFDD